MSGSSPVAKKPISPLLANEQLSIAKSSNLGAAVDKGAKDIHQTTKTAVDNLAFGKLSIISWGKWVVSKCGFLGYPLVLLVSPFLVPVSFLYDGFRTVSLLCRKIVKIETSIENLLPKADQHVKDVDQLLNEKKASDQALQTQAEQSDQLVKELQLKNARLDQENVQLHQERFKDYQFRQNAWQQANTELSARAVSAEQSVSELTNKLEKVAADLNQSGQEFQTKKSHLTAVLKQVKSNLVQKDDQVKGLKLRLAEAEAKSEKVFREDEADNRMTVEPLIREIDQMKQALQDSEHEAAELRRTVQVLTNEKKKHKLIWDQQKQEYINNINIWKSQLENLQNKNMVQKVELMNMFGLDQGQDIDLTTTEIFKQLKKKVAREKKEEFATHKKVLNAQTQTNHNIELNDWHAKYLGLERDKELVQNQYKESREKLEAQINAIEDELKLTQANALILKKKNDDLKAKSDFEVHRLQTKVKKVEEALSEQKWKASQEEMKYKAEVSKLAEKEKDLKVLQLDYDKVEAEKLKAEKHYTAFEKQLRDDMDLKECQSGEKIARLTKDLDAKANQVQELQFELNKSLQELIKVEEGFNVESEQLKKGAYEAGVYLGHQELQTDENESVISILRDELDANSNEAYNFQQVNLDLEQARQDLKKVEAEYKDAKQQFDGDIMTLQKQVSDLKKEKHQWKEAFEVKSEEIQKSTVESKSHQERLMSKEKESKAKIDGLNSRIHDLDRQLVEKENALKELQKKCDYIEREKQKPENELSVKASKMSQNDLDKIASLRWTVATCKDKLKKLQIQSAENERKNKIEIEELNVKVSAKEALLKDLQSNLKVT